MTRWLETDTNTNINISAATLVGTYTADADRLILPQLLVDQAAGGGDYVYYVTLQVAGAGSAYVIGPKTTQTAAAGETALGAQGGLIAVRNGDVVKVYVDGLAGDTATPDTTVRWFELAALRPTVADRTLDVSATGEAGLDWANVGNPTTAVALTSTQINSVSGSIGGDVAGKVLGGGSGTITGVGTSANVTYSAGIALTGRLAQVTDLLAIGGTSTYSYSNTVDDGSGNLLDGVFIQCATDTGFTNIVNATHTNSLGAFTVYSDIAGTHYLRLQRGDMTFTDQTVTLA